MNDNWIDSDPEMKRWAKHVLDELVPMIRDCGMTVSIVPTGETDIKFAVELGLSIMLDKPIIAVVSPGAKVPDHLIRVADAIVEGEISDPDFQARLQAAMQAIGLGDDGEE